jgi:radical SAM superfamily enzyme YgiQ (UPF0313 family)
MGEFKRYSIITRKFPREIVLLQGRGCFWKRCAFCDYYKDVSDDPYQVNKQVLEQVKGSIGALDVINSGSAPELDHKTLSLLNAKIKQYSIGTIWFDAHWQYKNYLEKFSDTILAKNVRFRLGIETFDPVIRNKFKKGIPNDVTPEEIAKYYKGIFLIVGMEGQTKEEIKRNIYIAKRYFGYIGISIFKENTTSTKSDKSLIDWFMTEMYPSIVDDHQIEVMLDENFLGIGQVRT